LDIDLLLVFGCTEPVLLFKKNFLKNVIFGFTIQGKMWDNLIVIDFIRRICVRPFVVSPYWVLGGFGHEKIDAHSFSCNRSSPYAFTGHHIR